MGGTGLELPQPRVAGAFMEEPAINPGQGPRGVQPPAPTGNEIWKFERHFNCETFYRREGGEGFVFFHCKGRENRNKWLGF